MSNNQNEEGREYDPVKLSPLSFSERCVFNTSVALITVWTLFNLLFPLTYTISFGALAIGFICAAPGLLVLFGFYSGRQAKKVRRLHTCVFISELIFLLYMVLYCAVCLKSPAVGDPIIPCIVAVTMFVLYVLCLEVGILRIIKKHEYAYYDEKLKNKLPY